MLPGKEKVMVYHGKPFTVNEERSYDAWLRMKDYQKAQKQKKAAEEARRAAAEEARQAEARRKEQEEREQQEREAEAQQEEPEPEQPTEEPRPAASTRFRRRVSSLNVVLAGCLLLSIVSGVIVNSRTRQLLSDTQAQLEEAEGTRCNPAAGVERLLQKSRGMLRVCSGYVPGYVFHYSDLYDSRGCGIIQRERKRTN